MIYEFLYYFRGSATPARENWACAADSEARAHAAGELLRMPSRLGVDVRCGARLVYSRRRGNAKDEGASDLPIHPPD